MARKNGNSVSAFDELLETISTPEYKDTLLKIADENPDFRNSFLRQSDYSRAMDEHRQEIDYANQWKQWEEQHWDSAHGMTKAEYALQQESQRLKEEKDEYERKLLLNSLEGEDMNLEELERSLLSKVETKFAATIAEKEKAFNDALNGSKGIDARLAINAARVMLKHEREFGESLDPDELMKNAYANGRGDLMEYYEEKVATPKRHEFQQKSYEKQIADLKADSEAKLAAQEKEFKERAEILKGMGAGGPTPSDSGPAEMGAFQKQYLGLAQSSDGVRSNGVPDKAVLGSGMIAQIAAARDMEKAASR